MKWSTRYRKPTAPKGRPNRDWLNMGEEIMSFFKKNRLKWAAVYRKWKQCFAFTSFKLERNIPTKHCKRKQNPRTTIM